MRNRERGGIRLVERRKRLPSPFSEVSRQLESAYQFLMSLRSHQALASHVGCSRADTNLYEEALDDFGNDPNDFM